MFYLSSRMMGSQVFIIPNLHAQNVSPINKEQLVDHRPENNNKTLVIKEKKMSQLKKLYDTNTVTNGHEACVCSRCGSWPQTKVSRKKFLSSIKIYIFSISGHYLGFVVSRKEQGVWVWITSNLEMFTFSKGAYLAGSERDQNMQTPNLPLRHMDYFELQELRNSRHRKSSLSLPFLSKIRTCIPLCEDVFLPLSCLRKRGCLTTGDHTNLNLHKQTLLK